MAAQSKCPRGRRRRPAPSEAVTTIARHRTATWGTGISDAEVIERDGGGQEAVAASRRRAVLLGATLAVPAVLVVAGITSAWPLFALPLAVAVPLGGGRGMAVAASVAGLVLALVSGRPEADGAALGLGLAAFTVTGLAVGAAHDARSRDVARMESLSFSDRLTGLHNYAYFADALPRECRRAERYVLPLSLVVLDLDRFKELNDRHGHETGNRLLAAVGEAIVSSIRSTDMPARYGGEEFAVIVPGGSEEALAAAERMRAAVARLRVLAPGGAAVGTTISAGVAGHRTGEGDDGELLMRQADSALYHAKASGRDRVSLYAPERRWEDLATA